MRRHAFYVGLDCLVRLAAALLLALPLTAAVASTGVDQFPTGDRLLFEPGGLYLLEAARMLRPLAWPSATASFFGFAVLFVVLLVPHGALLASLCTQGAPSRGAIFGRAVARLPTLFALSSLAVLAQVAVLAIAVSTAASVRTGLAERPGATGDYAALALVGVGLLVAAVIGLARDIARAAAVAFDLAGAAALRVGIFVLGRSARAALPAWLGPTVLSALLVALAGFAAGALDVSRPGSWRVVGVATLHALVAYALAWCRAFWLSSSVELVSQRSESRR